MSDKETEFRRFCCLKADSSLSAERQLTKSLIGLSEEVGELFSAFKKHIFYRAPLDKANVVEELGDIYHYFTLILVANNLTIDDIVSSNVDKLNKRYPVGYTDAAAKERLDKK